MKRNVEGGHIQGPLWTGGRNPNIQGARRKKKSTGTAGSGREGNDGVAFSPCELIVNVDPSKVEEIPVVYYRPDRVARQFGLPRDIPASGAPCKRRQLVPCVRLVVLLLSALASYRSVVKEFYIRRSGNIHLCMFLALKC